MASVPRVAFFTDTFQEINGVALTSRQLTDFARRRDYPFLCVRGASRTGVTPDGSVTHLELERSRFAVELDRGLRHDPALWRMQGLVARELARFQPDIVHVVSPGDVSGLGVLGALFRRLPIAMSWHTNLHEFGAMRLAKTLAWMPDVPRKGIVSASEAGSLAILLAIYRLGHVLFAPNDELVRMLRTHTRRPVLLMKRGIDTELFHPAKRAANDGILRIGFVGRITPEKNARFLRDLEIGLRARGVPPFRFLIIGDGSEREWLCANLESADLPGIKRGADLAEAYANMDVFAFPSRTDTFGNVVLEALASAVPAVVTDSGGPRFIVRHGETGFIAPDDAAFIDHTARLLTDAALRARMGQSAREYACAQSWDAVFDTVYEGYRLAIEVRRHRPAA